MNCTMTARTYAVMPRLVIADAVDLRVHRTRLAVSRRRVSAWASARAGLGLEVVAAVLGRADVVDQGPGTTAASVSRRVGSLSVGRVRRERGAGGVQRGAAID